MNLTKRKTLEILKELWLWCAENPQKLKSQWPGWEKYGEMENDCPCCEYCKDEDEVARCKEGCLLWNYWPGYCYDPGRAFRNFFLARKDNDYEKATTWALAIVALAEKALSELDEEEE